MANAVGIKNKQGHNIELTGPNAIDPNTNFFRDMGDVKTGAFELVDKAEPNTEMAKLKEIRDTELAKKAARGMGAGKTQDTSSNSPIFNASPHTPDAARSANRDAASLLHEAAHADAFSAFREAMAFYNEKDSIRSYNNASLGNMARVNTLDSTGLSSETKYRS